MASSLGTGSISIGTRAIGLAVDALTVISIFGHWPGVFVGYRGVLDGQGRAKASIRIPRGAPLVGLRVQSAFVTLRPSAPFGINSISETFSFSIAK